MNSFLNVLLEGIFVFSVIFIWLMLFYQFVLCLGGFFLRMRLRRQDPSIIDDEKLPTITVLVPARNEGKVLAATLACLQQLKYPDGKLEIMIINDGSNDGTLEVAQRQAGADRRFHILDIPVSEGGRGKSSVLNRALPETHGDAIAIYDADNLPEANALRQLAWALVCDRRLAAVTGKFRAYNGGRNLLTRFINLESVTFQWLIQGGGAGSFCAFPLCPGPITSSGSRRSRIWAAGTKRP